MTSTPDRRNDTRELREEIAQTRANIADAAVELRQELVESLDWREWIRKNPVRLQVPGRSFTV